MAPRLRKMRPYHPRHRAKKSDVRKQALRDLEHKISSEVSNLVLLCEEGNQNQIETARQKAKSGYLKYSDEMQKIAQELGNRYTKAVREFLNSVDIIVHSDSQWIDEAKVRHCYTMTEKLTKEILAA